MNSEDLAFIKQWSETTRDVKHVEFVMVDDPLTRLIEKSLDMIAEKASCIQVHKKKVADKKEPYIQMNKNIRFMALPQGKMLSNFLEILCGENSDGHSLSPKVEITTPVFLKIYISPFCSYCPSVVHDISNLALHHENIFLDIIDGTLFENKSKSDRVMSAPTLICDEIYRWTGSVTRLEVLEIICNRNPVDLGVDRLKAMIASGNASTLADMIIKRNNVYPAFYELIIDDKWPVRLGAMVAVEMIHEANETLSEIVISELWKRFTHVSNAVKGDIIYLTGESGSTIFLKKLYEIKSHYLDNELQESILEAIENIENKYSLNS